MIKGSIRERPDIEVHPHICSLKKTSKLVFFSREQIELILLRNLTFNGKKKALQIDMEKSFAQLRDCDVNHTKQKFTEIRCKLIIPETMLDADL